MLSYKTSIIVKTSTRDDLKKIASKEQTYDDIINELISLKRTINKTDPVGSRSANLLPIGSKI